jgi:streptogramin lyase
LVICALASLTGCNGGAAAPPPFDTGTAAHTLSGKITEFTGAPNMGPVYLTAGPDGNVWFTDSFNDRVGRITPAGAITEFSAGITALSQPLDIARGPDGNLWFTEFSRDGIGRITPAGVVTEFHNGITSTLPTGQGTHAKPAGIVAGPDGNLWFAESNASRIGRITPAGVVTEFSLGGNVMPFGIARGPDGNLWFTEKLGQRIGRITPSGTVTEFSAGLTTPADLSSIVAGPDGNLWFTEGQSNRIGRITPTGVITEFSSGITNGVNQFTGLPNFPEPDGIAAGPNGNLWFTEFGADRVGRITPSGVVTEFGAGIGAAAQSIGITAGPDGNLWFAEYAGHRIGRVQ